MSPVVEALLALAPAQRRTLLAALSEDERRSLHHEWRHWAHAGQTAPPMTGERGGWRTWVLMAGRGFGKTRAGSAWVHDLVRAHARTPLRIALVAATVEEARRIMVEGPSGLLATAPPWAEPAFEAARGRLVWPNGAVASLYSGANPEGLRGPEHHFAWCDELAKWRHPGAAWDMLQLGLRLSSTGAGGAESHPRALVTTTPRAGVPALRRLLDDAGTVVTGGCSAANPHLAPAWIAAMRAQLGGSWLGRQELDGELIEDLAGSLWPRALIEACRDRAPPARDGLARVVIGVDPPASAAGCCGIVACGIDGKGVGHVLADHSAEGLSPEGWAARVAAAAAAHGADRVVVETNQGGDMVRAVLRAADAALPVRPVTARAGKAARAEPVAALFEAGRVRLGGRFPALEDQLAALTAGPAAGRGRTGASPDRADAMVWALWALLVAPPAEPRVLAT